VNADRFAAELLAADIAGGKRRHLGFVKRSTTSTCYANAPAIVLQTSSSPTSAAGAKHRLIEAYTLAV